MEPLLPQLLHSSHYNTKEPTKADFFLIPHYSTCYYHHCVFTLNQTTDQCKQHTGDYVEGIQKYVSETYTFWNRSSGTDHLMLFSWDQVSEIVGFYHRVYKVLKNCIHLTTLGVLVCNLKKMNGF